MARLTQKITIIHRGADAAKIHIARNVAKARANVAKVALNVRKRLGQNKA